MKNALRLFLLLFFVAPASAQETSFDVDAYTDFLQAHTDLSARELLAMHPAGAFERTVETGYDNALYTDSLNLKFDLTPDEQALLRQHGFMVTERKSYTSFGNALTEIYTADLPVFISSDAILHAFHMSYDFILMDVERAALVPTLVELLRVMHEQVPVLAQTYSGIEAMQPSLGDVDVYLTVARTLLEEGTVRPAFAESAEEVQTLLDLIAAEDMAEYPLFAENCRKLDFSQFTPRGHYTDEPELTRYFQTMIWLGRTELYLIAPQTDQCKPSEADVQRQTIDALLLLEAAEASGAMPLIEEIDATIEAFVGEQDNVTLDHIDGLRTTLGITEASALADEATWRAFQETLEAEAWAYQRIQSQILVNGTVIEPMRTKPASAFMLFGQRFVIDSYVTGSVVYDKIVYQGVAVKRMLPSTLDVLYALGNDAAAQLLEPELQNYHYASNLAALRYLVDSYEPAFWEQSIYNGWLDAIRALNPPAERTGLPDFMHTAAWWQEKMNTQLAAWAQLRHDNLLYAKQSYTGVLTCSFPYSFVEPIPDFFGAMSRLARIAQARLGGLQSEAVDVDGITAFFDYFGGVNDTLAVLAHKEIAGIGFDAQEQDFLQRMLFKRPAGCYTTLDGWYPNLYYGYEHSPDQVSLPDYVVADVHTAPMDAQQNFVGWVLHAGTGPINLAVVTTDVPGVGSVTFAGPVMSYYEHLSTNFERLTDDVWSAAYAVAPSFRPDFVNLYLADENGNMRGAGAVLATGIEGPESGETPTTERLLAQNYPNPFYTHTDVAFVVPRAHAHQRVELTVYDVQGRQVRRLLDETLPAGQYTVRWDGLLDSSTRAASGVYFCRLRIGEAQTTQKMTLVR